MSKKSPPRILVTGGSGFLGSGVVKALKVRYPGCQVSVLDIRPPRNKEVAEGLEHYFQVDITSSESVNNVFVDYTPDVVIHTAGIVPARKARYSTNKKDWERVKAINYYGTQNVLDAALASGCKKLVYTSSCTVVVDDLEHDYYNMDEKVPLGFAKLHYGRSKGMAERYVLHPDHAERGLAACALRPCTIIGPGDEAVMEVIHDLIAKRETSFIVGDGDNIYDFMYIDNAVDAHVLAVVNLLTTQTAAGEVFFISNQEPVYFWDFFAYVWAQFGHVPARRFYIPTNLAWFAALVLEWVTLVTRQNPTLDTASVKEGIRTQYCNTGKAQRILGYEAKVPLAEGVRLACEDYKKRLETRLNGKVMNGK